MSPLLLPAAAAAALLSFALCDPAHADGDLKKVNHIIIVMQENHSFDNYFGVLPYTAKTPYHPPAKDVCDDSDHSCVDGLTCKANHLGKLVCENQNFDIKRGWVRSFHAPTRCVVPDLDHGWKSTHREMNFNKPNSTLNKPLSDGFVRVNDETYPRSETPVQDMTMSYFDESDIPFYYGLAKRFAISDRYFSSLLGPTIPNRFYLMAGTSFGHLTTNDTVPPAGGYKPITGTIFDLLDKRGVDWADYFIDAPQSVLFRDPDSHTLPLDVFLQQAAGNGPPLPSVVFIDPNLGLEGTAAQNDEHPPTDIQRGQAHVSKVVQAVRNGPYWPDSVIFITYDEHGGFYDHAKPPAATQGSRRTPDGVSPGQCADLSNPPASTKPGGGAECASNSTSTSDTSLLDAIALCPALANHPTGPFPPACANFDQLGVRVPLIAVSPFSKRSYVSHVVHDHTSLLAVIEKRFLQRPSQPRLYLTLRDKHASTLEDLFDFDTSPSLNTKVGHAALPAEDCTPARVGPVAEGLDAATRMRAPFAAQLRRDRAR